MLLLIFSFFKSHGTFDRLTIHNGLGQVFREVSSIYAESGWALRSLTLVEDMPMLERNDSDCLALIVSARLSGYLSMNIRIRSSEFFTQPALKNVQHLRYWKCPKVNLVPLGDEHLQNWHHLQTLQSDVTSFSAAGIFDLLRSAAVLSKDFAFQCGISDVQWI